MSEPSAVAGGLNAEKARREDMAENETSDFPARVHARFFAPDDNIPEDPATGSAAGSLAAYLVYHGAFDAGKFTIEQGDFMKRPSRIRAAVEGEKGNVRRVKIGGQSVIVAKGEVFFEWF